MTEWLSSLPNMQPYSDPQYFGFLLLGLLPIVVGMFLGKRWAIYETIVSFVFILLMFAGASWPQFYALAGYVVWQTGLVWLYDRYRQKADNKWIFYGAVALSILPLVIVKFTPLLSGHNSLLGFLGISYLTFKTVAMIMEMRDGVLANVGIWQTIRFILFMPTVSSGPIDRFRRFEEDITAVPERSEYLDMLQKAVWFLMLGFFYKFMLAYAFGSVMLPPVEKFALAQGGVFNWGTVLVMYLYGLNLFFDFAGYSLFAISISYVMGVKTPMNFNKPFLAPNVKEFWNRWHMSLSFWFRDYVFMRLVMVLMRHKVFKNRNTTSSVAYLFNMTLMGFWHGLTWFYIAYGVFHGLCLIINDWWLRKKKKINLKRKKAGQALLPSNRWTNAFAIFFTFNVTMFSFLLFSGFLDKLWFK
ncbi:D-alanyl-lipoteichoic acid biosynthesis protein DltB [Weissella ceti]|uniref:Teichoic acid D-alanyltransferase n=1 Tax=Weissella ceti TaxID=759620 RepID=A0ABT3E3H7_9LACO|nr:D-alanyl-lipoteichoic acid biosynthesis protein DltB [Weissella ceti]MCW0952900.1 D-alanyl-lipoteichoic acid biosynthesis protein DltB [Weissella ceti]QVK11447.1 D-alanyl-lipoteichoic acid biosynthesis protein DltB [Weissella ceti]